ncbi:MAG: phosphoribosylanthranilate isomerase [Chloroflexi bacterium]|nr:phosphoribosylanthranilate isomerase [Chloroflexota bacterium]
MTKVKICGITSLEDARTAALAEAGLLGFNFYKRSPRYITPEAAMTICDALRAEFGAACPILVGLFVNEIVGHISVTMEKVGLRFVQLSGDESIDVLRELRGTAYKAIGPRNEAEALDDLKYFEPVAPTDERIPSLLLDAYHPDLYGGTGVQASIEIAQAVKAQTPRLMLAGGLNPENVGGIVAAVQPWGVDVASGVEVPDQPGVKDRGKLRAFVQAVSAASVDAENP